MNGVGKQVERIQSSNTPLGDWSPPERIRISTPMNSALLRRADGVLSAWNIPKSVDAPGTPP